VIFRVYVDSGPITVFLPDKLDAYEVPEGAVMLIPEGISIRISPAKLLKEYSVSRPISNLFRVLPLINENRWLSFPI